MGRGNTSRRRVLCPGNLFSMITTALFLLLLLTSLSHHGNHASALSPSLNKFKLNKNADNTFTSSPLSQSTVSSSSPSFTNFLTIFTPAHQPPPNYSQYVLFNQLQNLSTSLRNTLSTLFILTAYSSTSTTVALTATLSFISRDAAGMLSTLLFSKLSSPTSLSHDLKRWRFLADIICNAALSLEFFFTFIRPPTTIHALTTTLCLANCLKAACGMMAGAASGPIDLFWSNNDPSNLPDISAKSAAQNTLSNSLGLLLGYVCTSKIKSISRPALISAYTALTIFHLYANRKLLTTIELPFLNDSRANIVINHYLDTATILTPKQVSKREPLLFSLSRRSLHKHIGIAPTGPATAISDDPHYAAAANGIAIADAAPPDDHLLKALFYLHRDGKTTPPYATFQAALHAKGWDVSKSNRNLHDKKHRFL